VAAAEARRVTDRMIRSAAQRLASMSPGQDLFPPMHDIRKVSREIAFAVAKSAIDEGHAAPLPDDRLRARIEDEVWEPLYLRYRPSPHAKSREELLRFAGA
jgi:malate dehydrogenase (oxaloacetate-decarboxylating)